MEKKVLFLAMITVFSSTLSPIFAIAVPFVKNKNDIEQTTDSMESVNCSTSSTETSIHRDTVRESTADIQIKKENIQISSEPANNDIDNLKPEQEEIFPTQMTNSDIVITENQATKDFIQVIGKHAEKIAHDYHLYASIMIAQAILESGAGTSSLACDPYFNLFGIKGGYEGRSVVMKTQEDDGKGNLFSIESTFRRYPTYKESLEDYARLLNGGLIGNSDFYKGAFKSETKNYQEATAFLTGKYATDIHYAEKLNQLIEMYGLINYDDFQSEKIIEPENSDATAEFNVKFLKIKNIRALMNNKLQEIKSKKHKEESTKYFILTKDSYIKFSKWVRKLNDFFF
ncbi:hypothetical protein A5821_000565 [Enterococcus sp. 7F3_DIV0205]|uniref:Mannosyl-glycoprotein endo-beta-N-acetylglucosamidase-like domain-containing protein n=1 Tax=Candidatus Enterococcus palustris TaxID=1834189 RepID=A0AAQ3W651_9ENTE|nr:glucosaminidase domain-containing protein [Enterococcus sp. 7F3_DIV0205]OTN84978.1 hypothetical protein A5821_000907 [Enterococcus sp. 7F3_DIV0205]